VLKKMVGKLTGKQSVIVIVSIAILLTGSWSFGAWLEQTKAIKSEELKSKDHIAALQALEFSTKEQSEALRRIIDILAQQGDAGRRALDAVTQTNDALLKAASSVPKTVINKVEVTKQEADILRTASRKKPELRIVAQRIKVVDINTADPFDLQIVLMDPVSSAQYRIRLKDDLFAGANRRALFDALESRDAIWVELAMKEIEGEIKSVQLLRVVDPPTGSIGEEH
jgi:hypothetical protein